MTPLTVIDTQTGAGIITSNPGELFWWMIAQRPHVGPHRSFVSRDFALVADMANHGLHRDGQTIAATYGFYAVRSGREVGILDPAY